MIRAYAREEDEISEFAARIGAAHGPRVRVGWLGAAFSNLSSALNGAGTTLVFAVGAYGAVSGRISAGEAVSAAALAGLVLGPIARLADLMNVFETSRRQHRPAR